MPNLLLMLAVEPLGPSQVILGRPVWLANKTVGRVAFLGWLLT